MHPETVDDLVRLITASSHAGRCVKVVGAGHSFNDIAATSGLLLCLDRLSGLTDVDYDAGLVTVLAGTTIAELNVSLAAAGLALEIWATSTDRALRGQSPPVPTGQVQTSVASRPRSVR